VEKRRICSSLFSYDFLTTNTLVEEEEEEEEDLFAKWITYKPNQINAKGGLPEEQTLINAGRPYNLTMV